jgi:hypothetical protein
MLLHDFTENKHCFVVYDMLYLEKSLGTHFYQFRLPKVRPVVVQLWKKLAWLHIWKANFSRFYICHGICIGSHRWRGHHGTLTVWLCDVVDTKFIRALHPTWDVPFLSTSTHFITRVDLDIFDRIALFHQNKRYFVAYDKLFLEKSIGTNFCLFRFTSMRPIFQ